MERSSSGPFRYFNLTEAAAPHHSPLIYRKNGVPGNFSPYSINSNFQVEQILLPGCACGPTIC